MPYFHLKISAILICMLFSVGIARAEYSDDIKFSDDMWEEIYIKIADRLPTYVSKDLTFSIPPFSANGSPETAKEIETLLEYQENKRTPEQLKMAKIEVSNFAETMRFGLGETVSPDIQTKVSGLIGIANNDLSYFLFREKKRFKRARPTQLSSVLTTGIAIPGHAAYPSGHAMQSRVFALVYGYVDSAQAATYLQKASDIAHRREIFGLHYPSDTQEGKDMADQFFEALLKVDSFRKELDKTKRLYELDKEYVSSEQ